ncbi:hypothetical protein F4804DRAFT_11512 [Jackrogersella minutella]|nr:hypothetical protein F4804DRAFT_11512 [Jackrogersella minutella]
MLALTMASPTQDYRTSLSPFAPTQASRGYDSRNVPRILVEATPENQRMYNEIRHYHERERHHLETHVASQRNLIPPPAAPSVSTAHSPIDDPETPSTHEYTTQDPDRPRRQRGKRKGPLDPVARLNTALKRKFKLACTRHRAKKTTCNCHDFSKLEEGYNNSLPSQPSQPSQSSSHDKSHDQSSILSLRPVEQISHPETFGAGGGAITPSDHDGITNDLIDLQSSIGGHEGVVRSEVQQIVNRFDPESVYLDSEMLQTPGLTYYPGNDISTQFPIEHTREELLEIGSQSPDHPIRWHCEYKGSPDAASETSSETCSWSGPFRELSEHFRAHHHHFHDISPSVYIVCARCHARAQDRNDPRSPVSPSRCSRAHCSGTCQKWYYGSTRDESVLGSTIALTCSDEFETGSWRNLQMGWNQSWLGGGSSYGGNTFGTPSSYGHSNLHNAKWDASSGLSDHLSDRIHILTRKDNTRWCPSDLGMKMSHSVTPSWHSSSECPIRLLPHVRLPVIYLLSVITLLVTIITRESSYSTELISSPSRIDDVDIISWLSLALGFVGFVMTWTLKDRAVSSDIGESSHPARGNHRTRNRHPLSRLRYGVVSIV